MNKYNLNPYKTPKSFCIENEMNSPYKGFIIGLTLSLTLCLGINPSIDKQISNYNTKKIFKSLDDML